MKRILFGFIVYFSLNFSVFALENNTFYLGDHVPDIYIYMDRINKKVYRQFRMIYQSGTNELVYCIEPGASLSSEVYDIYSNNDFVFNLSDDKFDKIKLIAYYGYKYNNHTDIKWYAITQYMIWKEIMPYEWDMYFVDENHNRLDNKFADEINEINNLVSNHKSNAGIFDSYIINNRYSYTIRGNDELINYGTNNGFINETGLKLDNLKVGRNDIHLTFNDYHEPLFFYNSGGQNLLKRGTVLKEGIDTYVYVKAGKVKINECNDETFNIDFIGGTYEILDLDDEVISTFKCSDKECISDYLPVGFHKIRVKDLPDNYEVNEHIYDVEVKDTETSEISVCSLPKKIVFEKEVETTNLEVIDIPYTSKNSYFKYFVIIIITISSFLLITHKYENSN